MRISHQQLVPVHVRSVTNADGAILLDTNAGILFSLNHVGGLIWERLRAGKSENEIARMLAERFQISLDQALKDIRSFSAELRNKQLLL